ncbi:MAG TPA: hypothetical protein VIO58_14300 [Candidatus Methanoperedens sp.]
MFKILTKEEGKGFINSCLRPAISDNNPVAAEIDPKKFIFSSDNYTYIRGDWLGGGKNQ